MMSTEQILASLPYSKPFLFVDQIEHVNENSISGSYTFRHDESFYAGHFVGKPVTPGVILIECMAQIGLVCLGIFLINKNDTIHKPESIAFTSSNVDFFKSVMPGERVIVEAEKKYWRLGKLSCRVIMTNEAGEKLCSGEIAGMIK